MPSDFSEATSIDLQRLAGRHLDLVGTEFDRFTECPEYANRRGRTEMGLPLAAIVSVLGLSPKK